MEFNESTQSFTHPTIPLTIFKRDLLQDIENCMIKNACGTSYPKELLKIVDCVTSAGVAGLFSFIFHNQRKDLTKIQNYEEIKLNYIFLLAEKYTCEVRNAANKLFPLSLIELFLQLYDVGLYTIPDLFEKYKVYIAKWIMIGVNIQLSADELFDILLVIESCVNSPSIHGSSKVACLKLLLTTHTSFLIFQNGYSPNDTFGIGKQIPEIYICQEIVTDGRQKCRGYCYSCKCVFYFYQVYRAFIKCATLFDLLKIKDNTFKPNAQTSSFSVSAGYLLQFEQVSANKIL